MSRNEASANKSSSPLTITFVSKTYRFLLLIQNRIQYLRREPALLCFLADPAHNMFERSARAGCITQAET